MLPCYATLIVSTRLHLTGVIGAGERLGVARVLCGFASGRFAVSRLVSVGTDQGGGKRRISDLVPMRYPGMFGEPFGPS
jgi:hypothetical protein